MKGLLPALKKASPTILTCIGAVGVVATAVLAVRATPKATRLIRQKEIEVNEQNLHPEDDRDLTVAEVIQTTWKEYIPAVAVGGATIACIFGANVLNRKQIASITGAYILLDQAYKKYKDKIIELFDAETDQKIRAEVAKDIYKEQKPEKTDSDEDDGKLLFYEEHYGRYFRRKMEEVMDAEYRINRDLAKHGEASLADFYDYLGLDETEIGDALGWNQEVICDFYNPSWIDFEHDLVKMDDGMECYIINILVKPQKGYDVPF